MSFFSVSFLFLSLWFSFLVLFSFSVCGFLCQAVVLFFCSLFFSGCGFGSVFLSCVLCSCQAVFFALVRLWSCGFGSVFLSCALCPCQAMFFCLVSFVFVRLCSFVGWLKFSSCGLAVFCFFFLLFSGCNVLFCSG